MLRFRRVSEPSIIPVPSNAQVVSSQQDRAKNRDQAPRSRLTFTGIIGTICWFPLKALPAIARDRARLGNRTVAAVLSGSNVDRGVFVDVLGRSL